MGSLRRKIERPRGIVRGPGQGQSPVEPVALLRFEPPEPLRALVEHLWLVRWSLPPGQTLGQATLPHPVVHWTVEARRSELVGVVRGRFIRRLEGAGRVVAVKFRPAGLCAFTPEPLHTLTDRVLSASQLLGEAAERVAEELEALDDEEASAQLASVLSGLERREDPAADEARQLVELVQREREMTRVEQLAAEAGLSVLALQRLFRSKVGVSPKWVIQRYRMHEALEQVTTVALAHRGPPRLAGIAYELGFTDQAHFCRVFKQFIGISPAQYAEQVRRQDLAPSPRRDSSGQAG